MVCFDTDVLVAVLRQKKDAIDFLESLEKNETLTTTVISACELFEGAFYSDDPQKSLREVNDLLGNLGVLPVSVASAACFGETASGLKKSGKTVEDFDVLIASIVLKHGETLVTRNTKHFERIKGLKLKKW
ncbi:type II toxin-antitoxin system VapC family toxin [Candidatus Micrarchaeota archaeon]|nr:type II toxin-antitoxin system VapC family toxin [Candidatus Micrarchaeota archaeon]